MKSHITSGVYHSNESVFHPIIMRHPWNSFTSLLYLVPLIFIPNDNQFRNYYGRLLLVTLTPVSFFWWALSLKTIKYIDNTLVMAVQIWLLSYLLDYNYLNIVSPFLLLVKNDYYIQIINGVLSTSLLVTNDHFISRYLFFLALVSKISDYRFYNPLGTGLYHLFSASAITSYFNHLEKIDF